MPVYRMGMTPVTLYERDASNIYGPTYPQDEHHGNTDFKIDARW